jgi:hypothetical protein
MWITTASVSPEGRRPTVNSNLNKTLRPTHKTEIFALSIEVSIRQSSNRVTDQITNVKHLGF